MVRRVLSGERLGDVSHGYGISPRTVRKWMARYRAEGADGLRDRSSRPHKLRSLLGEVQLNEVRSLRQRRMTGDAISRKLNHNRATIYRALRRMGLERLSRLEARVPARRYVWEQPGDLLHLDIKKLGRIIGVGHRITGDQRHRKRGVGWEYVHVCVDDATRMAHALVMSDERADSAVAFLRFLIGRYRQMGIVVKRIMTDNGPCYVSRLFRAACRDLGLKHIRTRPYTPRTNGKAERFIRTALKEWAYAVAYPHSDIRTKALFRWLHRYNNLRPHSALGGRTPAERLAQRGTTC